VIDSPHESAGKKPTTTVEQVDGQWIVRIDPHNKTCHGQHDILLHVFPTHDGPPHCSVSWQASVFLSPSGTTSFVAGLVLALSYVEQLRHDYAKGVPFNELFANFGGQV